MPRPSPVLDEGARASLQEDRTAVTSLLLNSRAALKRERERVRYHEQKSMAVWRLSVFLSNVVMILFALSQNTCECPVAFLKQHGEKKQWPAKLDEELATIVQDAFLAMDLDVYIGLIDSANSSDHYAMKVAVRFRSWYGAHCWVKGLNQGKGIAPPSSLVSAKVEEMQSQYPALFAYRNLNVPYQSNYRVMVHRWRRTFSNRYGSIRRRDRLSKEEMQAKVLALVCNRAPLCSLEYFSAKPVFETRFRSGFESARNLLLVSFFDPKSGPSGGSFFGFL